jgi:2'-5' RNA ligase
MASNANGGSRNTPAAERLNVFALVIYIPDPLGQFLDDLRRELVPYYNPHAHVSVLPPRPLAVDWRVASDQARTLIGSWPPFEVQLTEIQLFPVTDVIYIDIKIEDGGSELRRMHDAMNSGTLAFEEPFPYCPHITLAQEIPHADVAGTTELAARRWREYKGKRSFRAEHAVFVQATLDGLWIDLAEYSLGTVAVR